MAARMSVSVEDIRLSGSLGEKQRAISRSFVERACELNRANRLRCQSFDVFGATPTL